MEYLIGKAYEQVSVDQIGDIFNDIFESISEEFSSFSIGEFTVDSEGFFSTGDKGYFIMDNEILEGAVLTVEYLIDIKPTFNCTEVILNNIISKGFVYNPNTKLLSENATNASQGWSINQQKTENDSEGRLVLTYKKEMMPNSGWVIEKNNDFQLKIVVSTMLTTGKEEEYGTFVDLESLKGVNQYGRELNYSLETENCNMQINVIPPFGKNNKKEYLIILFFMIVLLCLIKLILKKKK